MKKERLYDCYESSYIDEDGNYEGFEGYTYKRAKNRNDETVREDELEGNDRVTQRWLEGRL